MADNIAQLAAENPEAKALIEEGLREQYKADNRDIPENFIDIVNTATAMASEYGIGNITKKNQFIFDVYSSVQATVVSGVFNYSGDDPALKAFGKAVAGVIGGIAFGGLGFKGVKNVAGGYYSGNFLSTLATNGYDVFIGPDYDVEIDTANRTQSITVDYTLADALLLPEKLKSYLKEIQAQGDWSLTDRNGSTIYYEKSSHSYLLDKTSFSKAQNTRLIDGLLYFDNAMTPNYAVKVKFSDTSVMVLKSLSSDSATLASMAKNDGRILYAVINLDPYYHYSAYAPSANPENYSADYINDRAYFATFYNEEMRNIQEHHGEMLYDPKSSVRDRARANDVYFYDKTKNISYGHQINGTKSIIFGLNGYDSINGSNREDRLYGMDGVDVLTGGDGFDKLYGGSGFDTYYVSHTDIIEDDGTGAGQIIFNDKLIGAEKIEKKEGSDSVYTDGSFEYHVGGSQLKVFDLTTASKEVIFIKNFDKDKAGGYLNIELTEKSDIKINISDPEITEGSDINNPKLMTFTISLDEGEIKDDAFVTLNLSIDHIDTDAADFGALSDSVVTLSVNNTTHTVTLEVIGDIEEELKEEEFWLDASVVDKKGIDDVKVISGLGTIFDVTQKKDVAVSINNIFKMNQVRMAS